MQLSRQPVLEADQRAIFSMWVAPAWRGTGVVDQLLDAVVDAARAEHVRSLVLWVTPGNARAAACYERRGFTFEATEPYDDHSAGERRYRLGIQTP